MRFRRDPRDVNPQKKTTNTTKPKETPGSTKETAIESNATPATTPASPLQSASITNLARIQSITIPRATIPPRTSSSSIITPASFDLSNFDVLFDQPTSRPDAPTTETPAPQASTSPDENTAPPVNNEQAPSPDDGNFSFTQAQQALSTQATRPSRPANLTANPPSSKDSSQQADPPTRRSSSSSSSNSSQQREPSRNSEATSNPATVRNPSPQPGTSRDDDPTQELEIVDEVLALRPRSRRNRPEIIDELPASRPRRQASVPIVRQSQSTGRNLRSSSRQAQAPDSSDEDDPEYPVEKIVGHRPTDRLNEYKFTLRFRGYPPSEDLEFHEKDIPECYELIAAYRLLKNLGPSFIEPPEDVGYTMQSRAQGNPDNWLKFTKIPELIKKYNNRKFNRPLVVLAFDQQFGNNDAIYLIQFANHALVGLYYANNKSLFIADGPNSVDDPHYHRIIEKLVRSKFTAVKVFGQTKVDYCATSAALIAIEFMKIYDSGAPVPLEISLPKWRKEKLTNVYHKEKSETLSGWKPVQANQQMLNCPKCDLQFKGKDIKTRYPPHYRLCRGKKD